MFNQGNFNTILFNGGLGAYSDSAWGGQADAQATASGGNLRVTRYFSAEANADATTSAVLSRIFSMASEVFANATTSGVIIRVRYFGAEVDAEANAYGEGIYTYGLEVLKFKPGELHMEAGDVLIIDMDAQTVLLNGANVVDKLTDASEFFKLFNGLNTITYEDDGGGGNADLKALWKDRYL